MKKIASLLMGTACVAGSFLALAACSSPYEVASMDRSRLVVDARYDARPDAEAMAFIAPYQREVDSLMFPVVGETTHQMATGRPESDLSNLLADIMVWAGTNFGEQPQLGVSNMGGIRANLPAGKVTKGDILNVAPFENKICFLTLTGEDLLLLFREIAHRGGEGVSHGVELAITKDGQLIAARLHGQEIDPQGRYRIATLDYVAQGNDHMEAFKKKKDVVSPQDEENNVRYLIEKFFQDAQSKGKEVSSKVEGRITVK